MCHTDGCGRMQLGFTSLDVYSSAAPNSGQANWYGRSPCDRMQGGSQTARSERPSDDIQAYVATHGPPSRFSSASRRGVDIQPCAGNDAKVSLPISAAQAHAQRRSRLAILDTLAHLVKAAQLPVTDRQCALDGPRGQRPLEASAVTVRPSHRCVQDMRIGTSGPDAHNGSVP